MYGPSIIPTIHFEPSNEDNLSTRNKAAEFLPGPKCPVFGGSLCVSVGSHLPVHTYVRIS